MRRLLAVLVITNSLSAPLLAETGPVRPAFKAERADEDWSAMHDAARRIEPTDRLKYLPLGADPEWYLSLGGEWRERYESSRNPVFGLDTPRRDQRLLHRGVLFADLHLGPGARAFVELASGNTSRWNGPAPATQDDALDVLQAFGEVRVALEGGHEVELQGGRQELNFGSSRLVSVRESPNIRRSFDGVRLALHALSGERVDLFAVRPVAPVVGTFDDRADKAQRLWGTYATTALVEWPGWSADLYYFGLVRDNARFASGTASERRHTVGTRLFGKRTGYDWNLEVAYQFGAFGAGSIKAWTASSDVGYTTASLPLAPRFAVKVDAISGDHHPQDGVLGTFNPLFPRLPYFSEANLVAPANLLAIQPNITLSIARRLHLNVGWNPLWKQSRADAYYTTPLVPRKGSSGGDSRFIGHQTLATLQWDPTPKWTAAVNVTTFEPGRLTRSIGGKSGSFVGAWLQWRF